MMVNCPPLNPQWPEFIKAFTDEELDKAIKKTEGMIDDFQNKYYGLESSAAYQRLVLEAELAEKKRRQ